MSYSFERVKHVYQSEALSELIKDAIRFFHGTPIHTLPPPERFLGVGVYALYYTGKNPLYERYAELNRLSYDAPIYVGKAVPRGWRQARKAQNTKEQSTELFSRLSQHSRSISVSKGLKLQDFFCRFVIFEGEGSDMISTVEAALIKIKTPLWNTVLDGFGNHDPGKGRQQQARSDWDVVHPGRPWADRLTGVAMDKLSIVGRVNSHMKKL